MRVLIFGNSVTQGFWDIEGGWAGRLWQSYTRQFLDNKEKDPPTIFNLGISGDTSKNVLDRFEHETKARHRYGSMAFVFSVGTNDALIEAKRPWATPQEYRQNLDDIIKTASKYSDKIMFLGLQSCDETRTNPVSWGDYTYTNQRIMVFDKVLEEVCQQHNLPIVPLFDLFVDKPELLQDGLHPNAKGHELIYQTVKPELDKLISS